MDIAAKVKEIIIDKLGSDEAEIQPNARFIEDLGADSLDSVELIMKFEEEFDIEIPDTDSERIKSVQDAIDYISKALN
ncbi:MAG TPA: acyl carrier protein [Candidatus Cloacimonadota bacterium]|nr:acyl carrier protein [Candidatus Cloacimonadales bacterium]HOE91795.1 acyl carrier protein [Candidatus Cloacimonadota bacterium]HOQ79987.1 acyl carrier protein [Candidatus Cloacimonadota bacterium]HPY95987.1 acyl carrier protein [Candidatus Cloacimonadota bacterium]HQB40593.1 acyl carrier protein [Candidatus Cloacimonadota bacterium]